MITKTKAPEGELWTIQAGGNLAEILPEVGGDLIRLNIQGTEVMHKVDSLAAVKASCTSYGFPILFPPNRIDGGHFTYDGKEYQFDINEAKTGNSLHGFLHKQPWQIEALEDAEDEVRIRLFYIAEKGWASYDVYPVTFTAEIFYTLNAEGLQQEVKITNTSDSALPYGLGWHSAFRITKSSLIRVSVGKRVALNERQLPSGEILELSEDEQKMRTDGMSPVYAEMDDHFTAKPLDDGFHGAQIIHPDEGVKVVYTVDPFYRHWMIWNNKQEGSLVCIEPQNWRVNAPNLDLPAEESGMAAIPAGESVSVRASVKVVPL